MMDHLSNRRRKEIAALPRRKARRQYGQTLVEGVRAVEAALAAEAPLVDVLVADDAVDTPAVQSIADRAAATGHPVYRMAAAELARLSDVQTSQGVLAVVATRYLEEDALVERLSSSTTVLALDGVQDPGNVGTLLRTAAWFGIDAVAAGPGTAGLYGPKVMRAAMGAHWDLQLLRTERLDALLGRLRRRGVHRTGADLHGVAAGEWAPPRPSALVVGSEAHGLSAAVRAELDETVAIPGAPGRRGTESLNAAVAAGILIYAWRGRRPG